MIVEAIKRSMIGLGFAAIYIFIALTIMMWIDVNVPVSILWKNVGASMLMGIYFGVSSLLFNIEKWSPLKQTTVHFLLSIALWLPLSIGIGWLPQKPIPILIGLCSFIVMYVIFWFSSYLYFKRLENEMNNSVKK